MTERVVQIFTPPFSNQVNFNAGLLREYMPRQRAELIVTGWHDVRPDLHGIRRNYSILARSILEEGHPGLWTLPRAAVLFEDCRKVMEERRPDLVIADYRSPEAVLAAQALHIPTWVSIPTVMGPNYNQEIIRKILEEETNVKALSALKDRHGIEIDTDGMERIFGNLFQPGKVNLVHTYQQVLPPDFLDNRQPADYLVVGNFLAEKYVRKEAVGQKPTIFISF